MTETVHDQRHFQRIFYNAEAVISDSISSLACKVVDISLKGCLLDFGVPWPGKHDARYELVLRLSEDVTINMVLKFAHGAGSQVGFKCEHIDIDSITNLRRLVELNLGNSEMLERDLQALSGL
ncbi:MAG: pilus assembly protein PilZ [Methylomonas sp.]|jgi:hypothetical protein|nr:MAG: pilus assembly protein PilZ [Methylomonas sp.]